MLMYVNLIQMKFSNDDPLLPCGLHACSACSGCVYPGRGSLLYSMPMTARAGFLIHVG